MPLTEKETLLAAFDDAWSHKWESFELVTKDITEEEAQYQHPVYASAEHEAGWPKPGTILWQLVHLEYWYRYYISTLELLPAQEPTLPQIQPATSLSTAMERLLTTRRQLRDTIASLTTDSMDIKLKGDMRTGEFIRMIVRHDSWHSAHIAIARRLYRSGTDAE